MSGVETTTKPILIPLIKAEQVVLDANARLELARWILLKVFVSEFNGVRGVQSDPIFEAADRKRFMDTREIPNYCRIFIGVHDSHKWESAFSRFSTGIAPDNAPLPADKSKKNTQSVTWGLGRLLIYLYVTDSVEFFEKYPLDSLSRRMRILWPLTPGDMLWPTIHTIKEKDADDLAMFLQRLVETSTWIGD
jgi:hypothetical protein